MTIEQAIAVLRGMETYLCSGNPIWRTDVIKEAVSMAIEALEQADAPQTDAEIPKNALRSDCTGCRFVGTYDTEFPCANCTRKSKDYYDADTPQTDCPWK